MKITIVQFDHEVVAGTYARWLQEEQVDSEVLTPDSCAPLSPCDADALLLLGGHMGVAQKQDHPLLQRCHAALPQIVAQGTPMLAICLGAQLLADALGGRALSKQRGERGATPIHLTAGGQRDPLFAKIDSPFISVQWHNDCFDLPPAATHLAYTETCPGQAFRCNNAYGVQFHPEVDAAIIADWCKRAGVADTEPLAAFQNVEDRYRTASRQLLTNFLRQIARK